MFPFNLPGPEFLVFYAAFAVLVIGALIFLRRRIEQVPDGAVDLQDPYLFACLRGGPKEVLHVALLGLIDRKLLITTGNVVSTADKVEPGSVRRRVDKELLEFFKDGALFETMYVQSSAPFRVAQRDYEDSLRRHRLIPDEEMVRRRRHLVLIALLALIGVAAIKIGIAIEAGRSNIWFLIIMTAVASCLALLVHNPYRTTAGNAQLANMHSMFSDLRRRSPSIQPGSGSHELIWLAALYGAAAVPATASPFAANIQRQQQSTYTASCGGGGSGGSCGGGGGGGGGCGGCGGGG